MDEDNDLKKARHDKRYLEIGYAIAYYRKHLGITQEELADAIDMSRHIGAIEAPNMNRKLSLDTLFDIADVLDVESCELLMFPKGFADKSKPQKD